MITRRSRYDLEAIGRMDTEYVPMTAWELDQIHGALKPLDAVAAEMEMRWGKGRLQELCSPDLSARFEAAKAKLDVSIHDKDVQLVIKRADNLIKGWKKMEAEAIERGHKPSPPELWYATAPDEFGEKEMQIVIARDNSAATLAQTDLPVYTVTEIARIVRAWRSRKDVDAVKEQFAGAEVVRIDGDEPFDDEIPF